MNASTAPVVGAAADEAGDPREPIELLLRDLHARRHGLSSREAARRGVAYGPNELTRLLPFPVVVWGADAVRRWLLRRSGR